MDWKEKLTSRKFWTTVAGFVTLLMTSLGMDENSAARVGALIMAGAVLVAYIVGEGLVDRAAVQQPDTLTPDDVMDIVDVYLGMSLLELEGEAGNALTAARIRRVAKLSKGMTGKRIKDRVKRKAAAAGNAEETE